MNPGFGFDTAIKLLTSRFQVNRPPLLGIYADGEDWEVVDAVS